MAPIKLKRLTRIKYQRDEYLARSIMILLLPALNKTPHTVIPTRIAFMLQLFREKNTFGKSGFPFEGPHRAGLPPISYDPAEYPGTEDALGHVLVLPINERYEEKHVDFVAEKVRKTAAETQKVKS